MSQQPGRTRRSPAIRAALLSAASLVCPCLRAAAQDGGDESLLARARAAADAPERWLGALNDSGFHPRLSSFSEGSGPGLGLVYWNPHVAGRNLGLFASTARSLRDYDLFEVRLGRVPHRPGAPPSRSDKLEDLAPFETGPGGDRFFLYASARRRDLASERFFGLGSSSRAADVAGFRLRDSTYEIVSGYTLSPRLAASARVGLIDHELGAVRDPRLRPAGELFAEAAMPGLDDVPDFLRVSAELAFDTRDEPRDPRRGSFVSASLSHYDQRGGGGFDFGRVALDARHYLPLGSPRHVLALRVLGVADRAERGARVPFFLQETLGGSRTLRGYEGLRFRGETLLAASAEYRLELRRNVELALLYDAGRVGDRLGLPGELKTSYGAGIRLKSRRGVALRLDAARSQEGLQLHFKIGTSF